MKETNKPPSRKGIKHKSETIQKMKETHTGEKNHFYGKQHSEDSKQKNRELHKNKVTAYDLVENRYLTITKEEFQNKDRYCGSTSKRINIFKQ